MSKYDFGYELECGSTNKWAFEQIEVNKKVLEVGPSVGNLTYHLSHEKNCIIDIVEIDAEAGAHAQKFAREALLGFEEGDLDNDIWYNKLKDERYDYIVGLDVLEHTKNPERILGLLQTLLTEKGNIILSIPNIAHNSVILELLHNRFNYSDLGLLDRTHIHFFAYDSIVKMIETAELKIKLMDAIKKVPSDTELVVGYDGLPPEFEQYLRTRQLAEVYQYLLILGKNSSDYIDKIGNGVSNESFYESKVLVNGLLKNEISHRSLLGHIEIDIDMAPYNEVSSIRFIPVQKHCIVIDLHAMGIVNKVEQDKLLPNWSTGIQVDAKTFILCDENHEINFPVEKRFEQIKISCTCFLLGNNSSSIFKKQDDIINKNIVEISKQIELNSRQEQKIYQLKADIEQLMNEKEQLMSEKELLAFKKEQLEDYNSTLEKNNAELTEALTRIRSTRTYRLYAKVKGIKEKIWKK